MSDFTHIEYTKHQGIGLITINRPKSHNALDREAKLELINAIEKADGDESIKVLILTGTGKSFSSGQDLKDPGVSGDKVNFEKVLQEEWNPLAAAVRNCGKIIIAAVNGVCAGAGTSLALSCDLLVAAPEAKFVSGFSKIGLVPDMGITFHLVQTLGRYRALEFFLDKKSLRAEELKEAGIVLEIAEDCREKAMELAKEIATMAPLSIQEIKRNLQEALDSDFAASLAKETKAQIRLGKSGDYKEGLAAFYDKRSPRFKGG